MSESPHAADSDYAEVTGDFDEKGNLVNQIILRQLCSELIPLKEDVSDRNKERKRESCQQGGIRRLIRLPLSRIPLKNRNYKFGRLHNFSIRRIGFRPNCHCKLNVKFSERQKVLLGTIN